MTFAKQLDQLCINSLRALSVDAVQQAQSGHPATPMGVAPVSTTLMPNFMYLMAL